MANFGRNLYYIYDRSGSRAKHMQDESCQPHYLTFCLRPKKD